MKPAIRRLIYGGIALLSVACIVAAVVSLPPPWPLMVRQAHQRWTQQRISHYQVDVTWADGWNVGHARIEMRDGQLIAATNLDTGLPLTPSQRTVASYFASVDQLFELVERRVWPSVDWRILVSRYHPLLERWLKPCIAPLSSVTFDQQLGFPRDIEYNNSWCDQITFFTYSKVTIADLTPLP